MRGNPKLVGLGADSEVRGALEDLISLMHLLSSRPTHIRELVPDVPHHASYQRSMDLSLQRHTSGGLECENV